VRETGRKNRLQNAATAEVHLTAFMTRPPQTSPLALAYIGTPEEIASAVLWLSSPGAAFTTGQDIIVDGGYTTQ
jgi:NAD(P)-dependent dehydrogenase (short-subunit alcohol dehydrogenase family)